MTAIKNIVLAGAGGAIGPAILEALSKSEFNITVFTRAGSSTKLPSSVKSVDVDFSSLESLTTALKGQDAVVSTLGPLAVAQQNTLIDAAIAAGVKRFIPSEFGSNTAHPKVSALPVYRNKVATQQYLQEKATAGAISYTLIFCSAFLDWCLMVGFLIDLKGQKAELYDGGDRPFSASRCSTVGDAVVAVLAHEDETKNRAVRVHDIVVTQNQLIGIAKKLGKTGSWDTKVVETVQMEASGYAELSKDSPDPNWPYLFIKRAVWGEGFGGEFEKTDNELLGLKGLTEAELEDVVKAYL